MTPKADLVRRIEDTRGLRRDFLDQVTDQIRPHGNRPDDTPPAIPTNFEVAVRWLDFDMFSSYLMAKWDRNTEPDCVGYVFRYRKVSAKFPYVPYHIGTPKALISGGGAHDMYAAQFTAPGGEVEGVHLILRTFGTPGGNVRVNIYDDDGSGDTLPNAVVANGSSDWVAVTSCATPAGFEVWVDFTFSTAPNLSADTIYHIVLEADGTYAYTGTDYIAWFGCEWTVAENGETYNLGTTTWSILADWQFSLTLYGATGTGTGGSGTFTDSAKTWPHDGYINYLLVDSDGDEWLITDNTGTVLTVSPTGGTDPNADTPANGTYKIMTPWESHWISQESSGDSIVWRSKMPAGYYEQEAAAEDLWNNRSMFCTAVKAFVYGPGVGSVWPWQLDAPRGITGDFSGADADVYWAAPEVFDPGWHYRVEVRDSDGGAIVAVYTPKSPHIGITYAENARIHSPSAASAALHFDVYTQSPSGQVSAAVSTTETKAAPAAPSNLQSYERFGKAALTWDVLTEDGLDSIIIYRHTSDDSGAATEIDRVHPRQQWWIDENWPNTLTDTLFYWLKARDVFGQLSSFTAEANAGSGIFCNYLTNIFRDVDGYASFSDAIDAIGATELTLRIGTQTNVTASKTVPATMTLQFYRGGSLNISASQVVTINGDVRAGYHQIFEGSGEVHFGPGKNRAVYPQWWGALGDDSNDDHDAIMAAADALSDSATDLGGKIVFPPGVYLVTAALAFTSVHRAITLEGASPPPRYGYWHGTVIENASGDVITVTGSSGTLMALEFRHLGINASGSSGRGFAIVDAKQVYIEDCLINVDKSQHAIDFHTTQSTSCYVRRCEIFQRGTVGVDTGGTAIRGNIVADSFFLENHIGQPGTYGISLGNSQNTVANNIIYQAGHTGIYASAHRNRIIGNRINDSERHGILVDGDHNTITANTIKNCDISTTGSDGVRVAGDYNAVCSNVIMDDQGTATQDWGVKLTAAATYNTIVGNVLDGSTNAGVTDAGSNNEIAHNIEQ